MILDASPEEQAFHAAYRRGRVLVLTVVGVTAAFFIKSEFRALWVSGFHGFTLGLITGWLFVGWICWGVLHGGKFARGCFSFIYGLFFLCLMIVVASVIANRFSFQTENLAPGLGWNGPDTLAFCAMAAWTTFSLWVLLVSKDASAYMKVSRRRLAEEEALSFEWKQAQRRQVRSIHAP